MAKISVPVDVFYTSEACETEGCDGSYIEKVGDFFLSSPPKTDLKCNKCGSITRLSELDWPKFTYKDRK